MSRSTRSGAVYHDENAAGAIMHGKIALKNQAVNQTITQAIKPRAALGDISNRAGFGGIGGKDKDGVKKVSRIPVRVAPAVNQSINQSVLRASVQTHQSNKQDDPMDTDDSDDSFDQSVQQPVQLPIQQQKIAETKPSVNHSVRPAMHQAVPQSMHQRVNQQINQRVIMQTNGLSNFDLAHSHNAQYVTPYVHDIMHHWRSIEPIKQPSNQYLSFQSDLSPRMREILIDWLNEVHSKFRLSLETLYLAVFILDKFLAKRTCARTMLQLAGCSALLLASKYEEIFAPECNDFVTISDHSFSKDNLLAMEANMLNALSFELTTVSPLRFLQRFQQLLSDRVPVAQSHNGSFTINQCSEFLLELTLQDYRFLHYLPSMLAASSLYLSCWLYSGEEGRSDWCAQSAHFNYSELQIQACVKDMCASANNQSKYRAVRKKYSDVKYGRVGTVEVVSPWA